jgi:hypothetical protein
MNDITVFIPISAIPSHPSTEVLDETIAEIRRRLPDSEIILGFDGLGPTLMHLKTVYEQHKQTVLWKINQGEYGNCLPMLAETHMHQSLMLKTALEYVRAPLLLWSEQDTVLHNEIPFPELAEVVKAGYANLIRFHHEASIHPEHEYLMLDQEPIDVLGQPFLRTRQWSGRPHLASTQFYREIVAKYWPPNPMFIEHIMYGIVVDGAYDEFRLHIYAPEGTLVRHKHTDGRRRGADHYDPTPS